MNRYLRWFAMALFAGAAAIANGAGGDGAGSGGGTDGSKKQDASYKAGVQAIERQDWQRAIQMFQASLKWDRFNADAHNWLGYAYRNAGDMKHAFAEYEEALRLDPGHVGAHEYVGEAYVIAKNLPKAQEHLAALEKICGRNCSEDKELEEAIDKAKVGG
jgi:tetratricopeptide (TPR) repeat protein